MGVKERYEDRKKKGETASYSGVRERSIAKEIDGIASSISERTNTWLKNHRNYLTNYNYRYSGRKGTYEDSYVSDASDWLSTISKQKENFDKEASSILSMLDEYGDYLNADWTDSIRSALTTASSQQADILSAAKDDSEYWSSFGSDDLIKEFGSAEEAYKYYQRVDGYQKKYNGKTYDELHAAMEALEDGEEKAWLSNYQYEPLKKSEDFAQYSQYANASNGVTKYLSDPTYEYINGKLAFAFYDALAGAGADYNYVHMNEDEISAYNYLYAKEGRKKAEEYLNSLKSTLIAREKQDIQDDFSAFAKKLPVISSIASVPISLLSGYEYVDNAIKYLAEQAVTGDATLDPSYAALATGTIRGTVSDMVDWEIGNWDAFDFLYSTVMSGADSMVSGLAFGDFGGAVLGLTAAAQATNDALERGMSDGQAFWNGLFSGVFEGLFETVSIGNFNKLKEIAPDSVKTIIKNLGKSMLVNASEETLTELANITYDTLINGEFANYTWGELKNGAWKDALAQVIEAGASGALMGVGMSGIGNAIGYYKGNKSTKSTYGKYQGDLVGESLEINPNNDFAQKMQRRIDNGKDLSGWQLNKLVQQNEQAMMAQDMETIRSAAAQRLTELGETGDVDTIASALAKKAAGQKLSSEERNTISLSKYGERVSNELNAENIRSGDYSSSWTGSVDTNRINSKEYGSDLLMELAMEKSGVKRSAEESSNPYASMENPASAGENTVTSKDNLTVDAKKPSESRYEVSGDGKTILKSNGEDVSIREVASVKNGKMTLRLEDGREVSSEDVSYASRDEALVYETVANMGVNASEANVLVNAFHTGTVDADTYTLGIQEAYRYGKYNYTVQEMLERGSFASMLTEHQRKTAYKLGQVFSGQETAKAQAEVRSKQTDSAKNTNSKKGGVLYESRDGAVSELDSYLKESGKELKPIQKTAIQTMKMLSDVFGIKFYVFESYKNSEGERVWKDSSGKERSINGYYDQSDGSIHIDLNAGADGKGTMLFTMAHELTHFIKQWSPAKFKVLANFLMKQYGENGVSVDALVRRRMKKTGLGYDDAYEEVVANSMESMLSDGNVAEKLAELKKQDRGLWNKIRQFINSWVDKLRAAYKGLTPDSLEGKIVYEMKDAAERLQTLFSEALAEAGENYQAGLTPGEESVVVSDNGDPVAYSNEYGSVKLSIRTYEEEGRQAFRDYLSKCVSSNKLTKAEMQEMMDGIEDIYQICKEFKDKYAPFGAWSDASVIRDTYGRPVFSVVTPNGEYKMNLDFSLVCKKRRTLDAVFNEMSRRGIIDYFELGQKSVVKINEIIRKYGFETACALCFVDAKRFRQASMADSFTNLYNELVTSLVPEDQIGSIDHFNFSGYETIKKVPDGIHTWDSSKLDFSHLKDVMKNYGNGTVEYKAAKYILSHPEGRKLLLRGDFMSSNGFDAVKTHNKDILKLYNSKKGTGGPKAAFGDVQYMNEVIKKAKTWTPAKAYAVGGVRIQSFSDYVPRMVFDYVQMIYDLAATKLPAHAYTKESLFAKQFGLTGVKINMSLIPAIAKDGIAPGLDSKGNYVWAGESFDFDAAKQIQNAPGYSENCGTICVGVSYAHIVKLLSDPDIRMVIPYHKSGLNPIVAHMNKIAEFTDYTGSQNTLDGNGKKVAKDFDFNKELQSVGDPKAAVANYLAWCDNKGYTPKFAEFRWHDNYYKLIEDFTLYDNSGSYVPQREVRAVFPTSESAFGSMKDLIKSGLEEDAVIEGKRDKNLSAIVDEIQNTLPRTEAEIAENEVAQADRDLESELADSGIKYSDRVTDEETLDFLNGQKTIKTYKTMQIVDGKLYPPMASRIEGKYEDYSVLGQWEQATEHPELIKENGKFKLDKGKGQGSIEAAYNPYMHSSNLVLNDQFSGAYSRDNLVTVECEVPVSEETSGYHAQYAKDSVGWHPWHTGTVAGSIRKAKGVERKVFLSRWIKPVRIVPDSEVASMYKELLSGTDVAVPDNVVTPSLLKELKKAGVKIEKSGKVKYSDNSVENLKFQDREDIAGEDGSQKNRRARGAFTPAEIQAIQSIGRKSINSFTSADIKATEKFARRYWQEMGKKSPFFRAWFGDWRVNDQSLVQVADQIGNARGVQRNEDTGWDIQVSGKVFDETNNHKSIASREARQYLPYINDIVRKAVLLDSFGQGKTKSENSLLMHSLYAVSDIGNGPEILKLYVEEMNDPNSDNTIKRSYQLQNIEKAFAASGRVQGNAPSSVTNTANTVRSVADLFVAVNRMDTNFGPNSPSKIVNADGTPKVVYHQTDRDFTVFDNSTPVAGKNDSETPNGFFFKDNDHDIGLGGSKQMAVYLDMKNPLHFANRQEANNWYCQNISGYADLQKEMSDALSSISAEMDSIENEMFSDEVTDDQYDILDQKWNELLDKMKSVEESYRGHLRKLLDDYFLNGKSGYDGIMLDYDGHRYVNGKRENVKTYIVFKRTQIKSATDNIGTFDGSNPDILMQDRPEESVSNRSLLANALESTAKNDIERKKIQEYKEKIELLNSEEQKLQELNAQVKELSFAKGPRDKAKIRALRDEAVKTANRINTYDRILLRLEASQPLQNVLEREKKAAYRKAEQKGKEALEAYRKDAIKKQQDILDRWKKSREKGIDSRNRTAMRHKIQNVVGELNQYLLKGTKDRHVPIELQKAVAEALDAVNMDTVGAEERIAKLKEELLKAKTAEQIQEISRKIERIQAMGDRMNDRLQALKDAYDKFTKSDDPLIANSHDDVISAKLDSVIDTVGDTPLRDMSLSQLKDVYDMYRMVLTTIRNANKAFKAKKSESISAMGNEVMMEVERAGGKTKLRLKGTGGISNFDWNNMKPVYAFERIGSDTLTELFNNVRAGEDTWAVDVTEAREYYLEKAKKYHYDSWDFNRRYTFTSTSGMEFSLSLEQIMSLYAYSKREQAAEHLKRGGIVFDETTDVTVKTKLGIPLKFNPTEATAYNISENTLADIIGKLSNEQKAFADEMQDYLSSVMGSKGNEVSLELYGIKLFNEKFYFPLKSAKQFMEKAREQQQGDTKIKNKGFSKDTVPKASNPIVLTPFMDVWADHVNEMSMYHAFVLPMEDFYRVYNFKTPVSETDAEKSVNMFLQNAYGKGATNYIDQLLKDLNGGARSDPRENTAKVLMSKFKKAAVMASISVVIQQPSAIARAFAMIDPKYFRPTKDGMNHSQLWEELKKYAPVAVIKEMGYFDTNMGRSTNDFIKAKEYTGFKEKAKALFTDSGYRDELISKAPSLADEVTWCAIWNAVKRETVSKHHDLSPSSEEFLKLAGERFTEVVTKTQVYDSVLARSGNMRSKTAFMNMWTSFMAEPTTSINMVQDALLKAKRGDKRYAVKAIGSVCASVILNAALVSLVYAMRDDDDDETYLEKYVSRFLTETLDGLNPLTYIPFLRDVWSIMQGFDIDRADMSLVTDLVNSLQKIVKVMNTDTYGMDEDEIAEHNRKVAEAWLSAVDSISSLTGIPFRNFRRDLNGAVNLVKTLTKDAQGRQTTAGSLMDVILDDVKASTPIWGWMPGESKADKLYDAIVSGDTAYVDRMKSGYDSEESYYSALRNAVRKRYVSGDISYETAMDFLIEQCGMSEDDAYWKLDEWNSGADGDDYRKYAEFYEAVQTGNNLKAVIKRYTDNGVKPETLSSQITDYFKPIYIEMSKSERASLKGYLRNAMVYCGSDDDAAMEKLQHWDFLADNPDYRDISQAEATKYYEYAEPNGISVSVYSDYCERASQCESDKDKNGNPISGSKKEKIMEVIDSLPITKKQKDALYYASGFSASTIYEAPWRR